MEKWINVNSFLPETDKEKSFKYQNTRTINVLITDGDLIDIAFAMLSEKGKVLGWYNSETIVRYSKNITHWTHLPELPNWDNEK
jgi:hypothetical protein